ncbi:MAG: hypothetical protein LBL90_08415 [Prevotellaceae bacterium]|jgi:hypothetical protein|nr:hypothetical protein [Prevotellaceae bacterium]
MKLSLNFLDRWESAIFNKYSNGNYVPVSTFTSKLILWAACILAVTVVILNFTSYDQSASEIAAGVIFGVAFLISAWKTSKNIPAFTAVGTKIGYASYILALFAVSSAIFITLAFVAIFIIMAVLALWVVWFFINDGSSKGNKVRIHYSDGTSEDADITGRGPTGETFVKGRESGREFQK